MREGTDVIPMRLVPSVDLSTLHCFVEEQKRSGQEECCPFSCARERRAVLCFPFFGTAVLEHSEQATDARARGLRRCARLFRSEKKERTARERVLTPRTRKGSMAHMEKSIEQRCAEVKKERETMTMRRRLERYCVIDRTKILQKLIGKDSCSEKRN